MGLIANSLSSIITIIIIIIIIIIRRLVIEESRYELTFQEKIDLLSLFNGSMN